MTELKNNKTHGSISVSIHEQGVVLSFPRDFWKVPGKKRVYSMIALALQSFCEEGKVCASLTEEGNPQIWIKP